MPFEGKGQHDAPRVALIHDFLLCLRGAERVFLEMCNEWPDADIFTPVYDERGTEGRFAGRSVRASYLQKLGPDRRWFRGLLPFYPSAVESFDLSDYDVVVSSSSAWAHAVLCDERAVHVSYCHNPFRYAWNERHRAIAERADPVTRAVLRGFFRRWRAWDWVAAQRVDRYVTNSSMTQERIRTYFGRESRIVHPPVQVERFTVTAPEDHYVVLSELVSHKRIELAIDAFAELRRPLVIVGDGPAYRRLRRRAPSNVTFAGRASDPEVASLLSTCRAFVLTSIEEFGIAAVEAQAAGRPVIARRGGGALETVIEGKTGRFWEGGPRELAAAIRAFDDQGVDPEVCRENARRFDSHIFRRELRSEVDAAVEAAASGRIDDRGAVPPAHLRRTQAPRRRRPWGVPRHP